MSMVKLIYSDSYDKTADVGMHIMEDPALVKTASTIFKRAYADMAPDKDHVGIHLTGVGAYEFYGLNRNFDSFPKQACADYHQTFVDNGAVFRHHRNKDRNNNLGLIKASAYNPEMNRIELFIHAHKERARDELHRMEKEGEVPFSMACFPAGTLIMTASGAKPIETLEPGDRVVTHTGRVRTVGNRSVRETTELRRVLLRGRGSAAQVVTPSHPYYAARFIDMPGARDYKRWRRRNRVDLHKYLQWVSAEELTRDHYVAMPIRRSYSGDLRVNEARLYGYYVADGSLSAGAVQFTCNINNPIVDEIADLADWTSVTRAPKSNSSEALTLSGFGTDIVARVEQVCGRRTENKRIPECVFDASREAKYAFVAAWFNGDGWQDRYGIHWSTASRGLALELQMLLAALDMPSSIGRIEHPFERGIIKTANSVEYVVTVSNYFSEDFAGISKATVTPVEGKPKTAAFISGDYLMFRVRANVQEELDAAVAVYNFSVADDESYVADGIAVHNCKVAFDRCTICDGIRKNAADSNQCDHIRNEFGKTYDDGRVVGTHNDEPHFFDISFVGRPADRIAWQLKVAANETLSSIKLAEAEGLWVPDHMSIVSASGRSKAIRLLKIAEMQDNYRGWLSGSRKLATPNDYYFFELRKAAHADIDDETLSALRIMTPEAAFTKMAEAGVVLNVEQFLKYATGPEYKVVEPYTADIAAAVPYVISEAVKQATAQELCNPVTYDAVTDGSYRRVNDLTMDKLAHASVVGQYALDRMLKRTLFNEFSKIAVDRTPKICVNNRELAELAKKYAAYQLSAVDAIISLHDDTDADTMCAIAAAQNVLE